MKSTKILQKINESSDYYKIVVTEETNRKIDPEIESKAQKEWEKVLIEAKEKGIKTWDGRFMRVENYQEVLEGSKEIVLSPTIKYSTLRSYQKLGIGNEYSIDYHTLHLSTIGFVITEDNYLVMTYREKTLNNSQYTFIGGGVSPDENNITTGFNLYEDFERELIEEAFINKENILEQRVLGIIHEIERMNIIVIYKVNLNLTKAEVESKFEKNDESDSFYFVKKEEVQNFVSDKAEYLQTAVELLT